MQICADGACSVYGNDISVNVSDQMLQCAAEMSHSSWQPQYTHTHKMVLVLIPSCNVPSFILHRDTQIKNPLPKREMEMGMDDLLLFYSNEEQIRLFFNLT